ncbi:hypothetical protein H6769_02310 [Candidatus Peribacteria bacterium]|nr:hypothetical protein [Candidatus Peribacteria bacterium]
MSIDKTVTCWGLDDYGQSSVPSNLTRVIQIAISTSASCALRETGRVVCW